MIEGQRALLRGRVERSRDHAGHGSLLGLALAEGATIAPRRMRGHPILAPAGAAGQRPSMVPIGLSGST
jgi:hypothetical protein